MKKIIHRTALSFLKYSIFTVTALAMAGCSTDHYYDSTVPPAAYTPQQDAAMQAVSGDLGAQTSSGSPQQPTILRQGDTVKISFPSSANLNETEQIRLDGKISLSLVGDVQAAGMTPEQLQQNLVRLYAPQISSSDVTVAIESSSFPVFVTGCVLAPGRISSSEPITALEAILEAGGFDYTRANLRKVHVIRREKDASQSYVLDLKTVLKGDDKNDFFLQPDDIVYVPEKFSWF